MQSTCQPCTAFGPAVDGAEVGGGVAAAGRVGRVLGVVVGEQERALDDLVEEGLPWGGVNGERRERVRAGCE
eukprot:scaffold883_cov128-Isochrysis_galbana.AAC.1